MHPLSSIDILCRLGLAFAAGLIIGSERESHGRAAGLRTTTLVCVASCVAMILSEHLFVSAGAAAMWRPDPARLAAGILTGIGFLGAGTIVRQENVIRGVTTAAVLWFVTVLGLTFGSGYLWLGLAGSAIALVTLFVLPYVERYVQNDWYGAVWVTTELDGSLPEEIRQRIESLGGKVQRMNFDLDLQLRRRTVHCQIKFKKGRLLDLSRQLVDDLGGCRGVLQVRWNA